ncbi:hypothetical protein D3C85_1214990 [compost metagenome]
MNYDRRSVICFMEQSANLRHRCSIRSLFEWLLTLALKSLSRVDRSPRSKCLVPRTSRYSRSMNMQSKFPESDAPAKSQSLGTLTMDSETRSM